MISVMADPDTETASNAVEGSEIIDLRRHSLKAVLSHNGRLWKRPSMWTQAHLQALSVDIDRQSNAGVDAHEQNLHGEKDGSSLNALIPDLPKSCFERFAGKMKVERQPRNKALALKSILVFPLPSPPKDDNKPTVGDSVEVSTKEMGNSQLGVEPISFGYSGECIPSLAVGRRKYWLSRAFWFFLGPLLLLYLDSAQITFYPDLRSPENLPTSLEARIVAILIAVAQISRVPRDQQVVTTRLLFTRWDDRNGMYVYTARISRHLLERFRHPSRTPTEIMPSLIKLQSLRVPYEPCDTFRYRILAAASVNTTIIQKDEYFGHRKRKHSGAGNEANVKRPRKES